jgi:hypothetical protein
MVSGTLIAGALIMLVAISIVAEVLVWRRRRRGRPQ